MRSRRRRSGNIATKSQWYHFAKGLRLLRTSWESGGQLSLSLLFFLCLFCIQYNSLTTNAKSEVTPITTPLQSMKIEEIVQPWYKHFVDVDEPTLLELLLAASYMDVEPLVNLAWLAIAIIIKVGCVLWCLSLWWRIDSPVHVCGNDQGKTSDGIREMFGVGGHHTQDDTAK